RVFRFGLNGNLLTAITGADGQIYNFGYDASARMTTLGDSLLHTTTFTLGTNHGRVVEATQADGSTLAFKPGSLEGGRNGNAGVDPITPTAALLAAAQAVYTDARRNNWQYGLDWIGFGAQVTWSDPLGNTAESARDGNALAWLQADELGRRERDFFDSKG